MYVCGICGCEINSEPDGEKCFDPPHNLSDYFFCSKECVRTWKLASSIDLLSEIIRLNSKVTI